MLSGDAFDTAEVEKDVSCVAVLRHAEDDSLKGKRRQRTNNHTVSLFVDCRNILVIFDGNKGRGFIDKQQG